jgi:hypothetical protein
MTMIDDDYTEGDQYDWDRNDSSQYCQHGKFIGSWWGPDILCGWCEDGISVEEMRASLRAQRDRDVKQILGLREIYQKMVPWSAQHLAWWMDMAGNEIERRGITAEEIDRLEAP